MASKTTKPLSASDYEAPRAREYAELMDVIHGRKGKGREAAWTDEGNVYSDLMRKEERVLDTVDRVVNDSRLQDVRRHAISDMSVMQIISKTADVVHDVYIEVFSVRDLDDLRALVTKKDRLIYIGIVVVLVGLFVGFVQMTVCSSASSLLPTHPTHSVQLF